MTKKSGSKSRKNRSTISTVLLAIVLGLAILVGNLTGIDVSGLLGLTTPRSPATSAPPTFAPVTGAPGSVTPINFQQGFGAKKGFWEVYFTAPTGSRDRSTYVGGIDTALAAALNNTRQTLDIAAFEWNLPSLTQAVLDAQRRGVRVRMVVDSEHTIDDPDSTIQTLIDAGIPVVPDNRSAFMHNKFMILDGSLVWTGSWNFTVNDTYRNNNNALALRSRNVVTNYQAEFNEMFERRQYGPRSPANTPNFSFAQDAAPLQIYFGPEDKPLAGLIAALNTAQRSVQFMTFSFTDFDAASALLARDDNQVRIEGIFETTGSETDASELRTLFCAGVDARQDGSSFVLHHKVFIIDGQTVVTGSFNISSNATESNDENLLVITDPDLAAQYVAEFQRRWAESRRPANITCS